MEARLWEVRPTGKGKGGGGGEEVVSAGLALWSWGFSRTRNSRQEEPGEGDELSRGRLSVRGWRDVRGHWAGWRS